jgi:hypothetical protein
MDTPPVPQYLAGCPVVAAIHIPNLHGMAVFQYRWVVVVKEGAFSYRVREVVWLNGHMAKRGVESEVLGFDDAVQLMWVWREDRATPKG